MAKTSRNIPLRSTFRFMPFLIHCIELERFPGVKRTYRFAHVSTHTHKGKPVTVTTGQPFSIKFFFGGGKKNLAKQKFVESQAN